MIETLAGSIVGSFLLPYLKLGADKLLEQISGSVGEAAGQEAVSVTKRIWERVRGAFAGDPKEAVILEEFEKSPESAAKLFAEHLHTLMGNDPKLAAELDTLANAREASTGESNVRIMAKTVGYGDFRGATIQGVAGGIVYTSGAGEPPGGGSAES
jgi:hypothetical protein